MTTSRNIPAQTLVDWLQDGGEIALLDVREYGQYGEGHPFFAVNVPYSSLEASIGALVPRTDVRVVVFDDADGVAERAERRLLGLGYDNVHVLQGGAKAWSDAGQTLFKGVNLPSKTFGELVEHLLHTPHISALDLHQRMRDKQPYVLVDGRTLAEHRKMAIPGSIPIPNGELAHRIASVLPDKETPVIVHCAGRTRSIIGAQILIELGLPNPVYALENGTQGWALAGLELEHGSPRHLPEPAHGDQPFNAGSDAWDLSVLTAEQAQQWLDDTTRTTFLLDVRTADEFQAASIAGARHAPGGQLIQATDQFIGVRNSRVLLVDSDVGNLRARVVARWLSRLGFEAAAVRDGVFAKLHVKTTAAWSPASNIALEKIGPELLRDRVQSGAQLVDLRSSREHRQAHPAGAAWSIRPRLPEAVKASAGAVILLADNAAVANLAAVDLRESGVGNLAWCDWATYERSGLEQRSSSDQPSDEQAIDFLYFVHDRHDGNLEAARRYLEWETGLLAQCKPFEVARFKSGLSQVA